jgi:hypothetical protein
LSFESHMHPNKPRKTANGQAAVKVASYSLVLLLLAASSRSESPAHSVFISWSEARSSLAAYSDSLPEALRSAAPLDESKWAAWVATSDREVRARLARGQEDTLSNLLRFGVTFTHEYRIDDEYLPKFGHSSLVDSFADRRATDLVRALASPHSAEGFREMRAFLEEQGYSFETAAARLRAKKVLLENLARLRDDFVKAHSEPARENRWQSFEARGISLDTNLWPDFDLDAQLRAMAQNGSLQPGSVRRIAIIGPGLDFVNKQQGYDFYPPQTIQPFAVLDSLVRLKLADSAAIEIYTLDISASVNLHIERALKNAAAGKSYVLQLPWYQAGRWSEEFRGAFIPYWQNLGSTIGTPVPAIRMPEGAEGIESRAIELPPAIVRRITPLDVNIVYQRLALDPEQGFDLVIGTNVFVYYGAFEQSLVRANVASMLKSGGFLLSSEKLADRVENGLALDATTEIPMTGPPVMTDFIFAYRRK